MVNSELERFVSAQADLYDSVRQELRDGRKKTHWMWFIFPQLKGLGRSATAAHFGIDGLDEARRYLRHPILGARLRDCTHLLLTGAQTDANKIFGFPDDMKLRSSLTLFLRAAENKEDADLFQAALDRFFDGDGDDLTLARFGEDSDE